MLTNAEKRAIGAGRDIGKKRGLEIKIKRADLIIFILPPAVEDLKNRIKHWGDVDKGITTQCLVGKLFSFNRDALRRGTDWEQLS